MRIALNSLVRTKDGRDIGRLEAVIINAPSKEVSGFALASNEYLGRDVVVPREEIESVTEEGEEIRLRLNRSEVDALPGYTPSNYTMTPSRRDIHGLYHFPSDSFIWPAPFRPGGEAWESAAGPVDVPPYNGMETNVERQEQRKIGIAMNTPVFDLDGHRVGAVEQVLVNAQATLLQAIVIRLGDPRITQGLGHDFAALEVSTIDSVRSEGLYLRIKLDESERDLGDH